MKKNYFELTIGAVTIFLCMVFVVFVMKTTSKKVIKNTYTLNAIFENIEGININTKVKIGGVEIGKVSDVKLNKDFSINVRLTINNSIKIPLDSNIKISTSGIIGGKYLKIIAGNDDKYLKNGDYFDFTESTLDLEDMITKFMLNKVSNEKK